MYVYNKAKTERVYLLPCLTLSGGPAVTDATTMQKNRKFNEKKDSYRVAVSRN